MEDYESTLQLLQDMRSLIRVDHMSAESKLHAIDSAITEAIGGSPERAREFVQQVALGMIEDGQ